MSILQISITAAILILAIAVIRALVLHKLPKITFVALWCVVLFRLLTPFSIPLPFDIPSALADRMPEVSMSGTQATNTNAVQTPIIPADNGNQIPLLAVIWVIGMIVCALFFLVTHLRCRREYKTALLLENDFVKEWLQEQKLRRTVQIRYSDRINAPMTYGIFKPVILFPKITDCQDETELRIVLTHELTHIKRFDVLTKWLLAAAVCVHWFNPLAWVMYVLANRDIEMSCDEKVVWTFGEQTCLKTMKSAYALTLIGLEETKSGFSPLCTNFAKNAIEERINSIMKIKKATLTGLIMALVLVAGLTLTAFAAPATAQDKPEIPSALADKVADLVEEYDIRDWKFFDQGDENNPNNTPTIIGKSNGDEFSVTWATISVNELGEFKSSSDSVHFRVEQVDEMPYFPTNEIENIEELKLAINQNVNSRR